MAEEGSERLVKARKRRRDQIHHLSQVGHAHVFSHQQCMLLPFFVSHHVFWSWHVTTFWFESATWLLRPTEVSIATTTWISYASPSSTAQWSSRTSTSVCTTLRWNTFLDVASDVQRVASDPVRYVRENFSLARRSLEQLLDGARQPRGVVVNTLLLVLRAMGWRQRIPHGRVRVFR